MAKNLIKISLRHKIGVNRKHLMYVLLNDIAVMVQIKKHSNYNLNINLKNQIVRFILLMAYHTHILSFKSILRQFN